MYELLGGAAIATYVTFVFTAERFVILPVSSSHVARRKYLRGRRYGAAVFVSIVLALAWIRPG